jgi:hypothetical protein
MITTNCLLQVAQSRRSMLRTFHTTYSQRLQSISIKYQYHLYFLGNNNPSSSATRSLSTTTATTPPPPRSRSTPIIPAPTWSLQSLGLSQTHAPVSDQELSRLTKRAVFIDLSAMDSHSNSSSNSNTSLAQELGNMMHMIQQVQSLLPGNEMEHLTDAAIYDVPRGVTCAPVRRPEDTSNQDATTSSTTPHNAAQPNRPAWWESFLKPHTTTVGAHSYFAVVTQRDENKSK